MMKKMNLMIFLLLIPYLLMAQAERDKVQAGNKLFLEEKFEEANGKYRDALLDAPESPVIKYNIAGTEYKIGKFEDALENYSQALSPDLAQNRPPAEERLLRSQVHYNRGNAYYRLNKYLEAIREYQEALKLNPEDEDAKYNLEFVRNKLKNQSQQQNPDQQQQQQQQQQEQQQQQQQQDEQDENEKQDEEQQQQEQEQQQEQQQSQPQDMQEMTKEDAERILDALKDDEKEEQQKRKQQIPVSGRPVKDW